MALDVLSTVQRSMEGRDIGIIAPFTPRSSQVWFFDPKRHDHDCNWSQVAEKAQL